MFLKLFLKLYFADASVQVAMEGTPACSARAKVLWEYAKAPAMVPQTACLALLEALDKFVFNPPQPWLAGARELAEAPSRRENPAIHSIVTTVRQFSPSFFSLCGNGSGSGSGVDR
jgi:hypothetical protein